MKPSSLVSPIGGVVAHIRPHDGATRARGEHVYVASAGHGRHPEHAPALLGVGVGEDEGAAGDDALRRALGLYAAGAWDPHDLRWASADELGDDALVVEDLARVAAIETRDRIRWVEGFALDDGRPIWIPAVLAFVGLPVAVEAESFWPASTAGISVAPGLGAAVLDGLLDCIARDAAAVVRSRRAALPMLSGGDVRVYDATTDVGIPAAVAVTDHSDELGVAAAATRAAAVRAARNDLLRRQVQRALRAYPEEPPADAEFDLSAEPSPADADNTAVDSPVDTSKPALVARLRRAGVAGDAVDLTTDELARVGLAAVRTVVPGLSPIPPHPGWTDHARLARVSES
jgi:ribosomal protein S12 methylthiotransferase accessory factor